MSIFSAAELPIGQTGCSRSQLPQLLAASGYQRKTLHRNAADGLSHFSLPAALSARLFHSSVPASAVEEVLVPSMGDSITEGTIVNVGKAAGDAVKEDEVIAQIETDKVTIDVRAPKAGTLTDILVKGDDNVEVGQIIAKLDTEGGGGSSTSAAVEEDSSNLQKQKTKEKPSGKQQQAAKSTPAPEVGGQPAQAARPQPQDDEHSGGSARVADPGKPQKARLTFPPRHTADGRRISSLPAAEAAAALAELTGSASGRQDSSGAQQQQQEQQQQQAAHSSEPQQPEEIASEMEGVRLRRWAVGASLPMDEDWQPAPGKWALSASEMEMIDLGGADP